MGVCVEIRLTVADWDELVGYVIAENPNREPKALPNVS